MFPLSSSTLIRAPSLSFILNDLNPTDISLSISVSYKSEWISGTFSNFFFGYRSAYDYKAGY